MSKFKIISPTLLKLTSLFQDSALNKTIKDLGFYKEFQLGFQRC